MSRLEQLRKLAALTPDDPLTHYALGLEHIHLEQWEEAIAAFERTLTVDVSYAAAYYHKARAESKAGRRAAAGATLARGMEVATAQGDLKTAKEMRQLLDTIT